MAFVHGKDGKVILNTLSVSAKVQGYSASHSRDASDATCLQDGGAKTIPGLMTGKLSIKARYESGTDTIYSATSTARTAADNSLYLSVFPEGDTVGKGVLFMVGDMDDMEIEANVQDVVSLNFNGLADAMVDMGRSLHALAAETTSTNSASVDNGASSPNGAAALLHVTAPSSSDDTLDVKVQHSTDDAVWVDLITFTQATAVTQEFKTVAAGTTVNRYARASSTIAGTSPTFTYAVSFARR